MLIKIAIVFIVFFLVKNIFKMLNNLDTIATAVKDKKAPKDDIIDAEFKVVDEKDARS